ncbi:MAG: hypothetical protein AAB604_02415 [Patescibacteria group bacterium]
MVAEATADYREFMALNPGISIHKKIPQDYDALIKSTVLDCIKTIGFPLLRVEIGPSELYNEEKAIYAKYYSTYGNFTRAYTLIISPLGISRTDHMTDRELVCRATALVAPHKLHVKVRREQRKPLPYVEIIGPSPGIDIFTALSKRICSTLPVSRVIYELARKTER